MRANQRKLALVLVMIACALFGACKGRGRKKGGNGANQVAAKMMDLPAQIVATGTVTPRVGAEIKVGPRLSGQLNHLSVKIGDVVKKGQVLGILDDKDLKANVARAEASLKDAQANAKYTAANYERMKELLPKGYISQDAVDAALRAKESAEAQVKNAQASLDYSKIQLSYATIVAPINGIVETVATNEGETVAASFNTPTFVQLIDLSRLEVDTYVDEVDIGGVKIGQKATFTVDAFPDRIFHGEVEAIQPQAVIQDNVVTYDVIIGIKGHRDKAEEEQEEGPKEKGGPPERREREKGESSPGAGTGPGGERPGSGHGSWGQHQEGRPDRAEHRGPAAGTEAEKPQKQLSPLESFEGLLRPKMTATVTIELDATKGALVIPAKAVRHEGGKAFIMIASPKGPPIQRPVTLGKESGDYVQVKAGVSEGEKVLVQSGRQGEGGP